MAAAAAVAAAAEVRAAVTEEIVLSEQRYYGRLLKLESQFYRPLRSALTCREHASIFGCLESIVGVHRHLAGALPSRGELACMTTERRTAAVVSAVTEVLPFLRMYSGFISNFEASLDAIAATELRLRPPASEDLSVAANRAKLEALLIEPVQRIPRYRMLLEKLLAHTPPDHTAHADLETCVEQIAALALLVNDRPRHREQRCRLLQLHRALGVTDFARHFAALDGFALAAPHRRLLSANAVEEFDPVSGISEPAVILLCNDLICKARPVLSGSQAESDGSYELLLFDGLIWLRDCSRLDLGKPGEDATGAAAASVAHGSSWLKITPTPWPKNIASCQVEGPSSSGVSAESVARWDLWFTSTTDLIEWSAAVDRAAAELALFASSECKEPTRTPQDGQIVSATTSLVSQGAVSLQRSLSAPPLMSTTRDSQASATGVECYDAGAADASYANEAEDNGTASISHPILPGQLAAHANAGLGHIGRCSHGPVRTTSPLPDVSWSTTSSESSDSPHLVLVRELKASDFLVMHCLV